MSGKTAIVTGANTGIGKETALDFAKRGAKVILACRDEAKANQAAKDIIAETGSDKVLVRVVDLSSFESVRAFAKLVNETEERLDILVNNAGLFGSHPSPSKDGYEMIMQVNYVSHFLLTLLLMEKLRKSAPSRIVNVSSMGSTRKDLNLQLNKDYFITLCSSSFQRYAESKLAQVLFTKELSQRLEGQGIILIFIRVFIRHWRSENSLATTQNSLAKVCLFPDRALPFHNSPPVTFQYSPVSPILNETPDLLLLLLLLLLQQWTTIVFHVNY